MTTPIDPGQALLQEFHCTKSPLQVNTQACLDWLAQLDDPNIKDEQGRSLLALATMSNQPLIVQKLITMKANVNFGHPRPLTCAAWNCLPGMISVLCEAGAEVNHQEPANGAKNGGGTALMGAAWQGNTDCVRLLLAHDADPAMKDNEGKTALDRCQMSGVAGKNPVLLAELLTRAAEKRMQETQQQALKKTLREIDRLAHSGMPREQQAPPVPDMRKKPLRRPGVSP